VRQLGKLGERASADSTDVAPFDPDIPALTTTARRDERRVVAANDDQTGLGVELPGVGVGIAVWPMDPSLPHGGSMMKLR
jgi:hypothetical protein